MKEPSFEKRFLAPQAQSGDGRGYLRKPPRELLGTQAHVDEDDTIAKIASATALSDEPEAISDAEWAAHVDKRSKSNAEQQQKFEDAQREQQRRMLTFEQRLQAVTQDARRAKYRVDISRDLRLLIGMQQAGKGVRHLEQRLYMIERKVWSTPDATAA